MQGRIPAKSLMIDKVRSNNFDDLELFSVFLAVLRGTGRHTALTSYIDEYLASLITQPQNFNKLQQKHNLYCAVAIVGDLTCAF